MIRYIEGRLSAVRHQAVVVIVHNLGYLIHTNTERQSLVLDETVAFHTHLAVRENALDLYGFKDARELVYFELLLSVPKIGPKSALQILAQADPDLIATAVLTDDALRLHKVSGVGKKTAVNIVTALAGKIDSTEISISSDQPAVSPNILTSAQTDAIDALITLGYDEKNARLIITKLDSALPAKDLIHLALRQTNQ